MNKKMKPLTATEKKWLDKLKVVLMECPSKRMSAFTIGDAELYVYDNGFDEDIDEMMDKRLASDFCLAVDKLKCELAVIDMPFYVHSTAG